jgi:hypothetical protein
MKPGLWRWLFRLPEWGLRANINLAHGLLQAIKQVEYEIEAEIEGDQQPIGAADIHSVAQTIDPLDDRAPAGPPS